MWGVGPGSVVAKFQLPEAHTDYIFSVIGEEFGLLACIAIACVYLAILVRVFLKLLDEEDNFVIFAAAGLATQFGLQAIINMGVNTQIFPSRSEEHTSELQSLMRTSYAVFCLKKKKQKTSY